MTETHSARKLERFEEVEGEFVGCEVDDGGVVVIMRVTLSFRLPLSAARFLAGAGTGDHALSVFSVGDSIAILRADDGVYIRALSQQVEARNAAERTARNVQDNPRK